MQYRLAKIETDTCTWFLKIENIFTEYYGMDGEDSPYILWDSLNSLLEFAKPHIQKGEGVYYTLDTVKSIYDYSTFEFTTVEILDKYLTKVAMKICKEFYLTPIGFIHETDIPLLGRIICPICNWAVKEDEYMPDSNGNMMCPYCLETGEGTDEVESEEIYNDEGEDE
jgi:hypothetical protein